MCKVGENDIRGQCISILGCRFILVINGLCCIGIALYGIIFKIKKETK